MKNRIAPLFAIIIMLVVFNQPVALGDCSSVYDMGIPDLNGQCYSEEDMNMNIFWVQTQMKATGVWYQGEQWDCTGHLGNHTRQEIASFMRSQGYSGHSGTVDQNVINELANWLGVNMQPVYAGGFYEAMDSIMIGGSTGSMNTIVSNLRDMVPRETVGARWIQVCLKYLGYYNSNIDGKYGEGTELAVKAFQRDHGFQERDYVSLGVARAMIEQYYWSGGELKRLPCGSDEPAVTSWSLCTPSSDNTWQVEFLGINKNADDNYSNEPVLRAGDTVYFHGKLTGGASGEKVLLKYSIHMNGKLMDEGMFSERFGNNSYIWVRNTPFRYGTLSISLYYTDKTGRDVMLGSTSVYIEARTNHSQTETARGWISGCDLYINRHGSLCFDLTGYESSDRAIIFFIRDYNGNNFRQGTVSNGLVIWDTPTPNQVYEYAIWCGPSAYSQDVATLSESQIPATAWIRLYINHKHEINIVSSSVAINIRDNE